jgi:SnoaL-like polyketide cyclase
MEQENLSELMKTLDDAWNSADWEVFRMRHAKDVKVTWPGGNPPTIGIEAHITESQEFFKTFPDNHIENNPYRVFFTSGEWTCSIARFTGTMKGPMKMPDGKEIPPTYKSFELDFCTVARWVNGKIVEENLWYDQVGLMKQIGLS